MTTTLATLSGLEVGTTSTCSLNATARSPLFVHLLTFLNFPHCISSGFGVLLAAPVFIISFVQQLYSSGSKEITFLAHIKSAATAGRSMDHLLSVSFSSVSFFQQLHIERQHGFGLVWPVKGVFLSHFSYHHHFIISLRAAVE
jgi:hypothetical protein